jgi:Ca2+/Na+ antiporter
MLFKSVPALAVSRQLCGTDFTVELEKLNMKTLKNNSLSLVFFLLFIISLIGQIFTGLKEHNQEMLDEGGQAVGLVTYLTSGHFLQSTFENWESEFLQMALYVILSMFLYQKGSSESKDPDKEEEVDREPNPKRKDAPWPVKKGGFILSIYKHSLCYVLFLFFVLSFLLHWYGSLKDHNEELLLKGQTTETALQYLSNSRFWFESFQNWQSEFLSVFAIVVLSIFLREQGSPQSKPVDAPHSETGG